jgi:large subunit ribosomal protein L21
MKAIVETGGMQFPVEEKSVIRIPLIEAEIGKQIDFDKVLMISGDDKFDVGKPYVVGAKVTAEVLAHGRDDKVVVFKFKKRTKYRKTNGHRQDFTEVKILGITA